MSIRQDQAVRNKIGYGILAALFLAVLASVLSNTLKVEKAEKLAAQYIPNSYLADSLIYKKGFQFDSVYYQDLRFYFEDNSYIDKNLAQTINNATEALRHCMLKMGYDSLAKPIALIYLRNKPQMETWFGIKNAGLAFPESNCVVMVGVENRKIFHKHELMHILSIRKWGRAKAPSSWLQEGLATYADSLCNGFTVHEVSASLMHLKMLPKLELLINQFDSIPDIPAYLHAASVTQYFIEKYGWAKYEQLWKLGVPGFRKITKKSVRTFDKEYRAYLKKMYPINPPVNWVLLSNSGCG